VKIVSQTFRAAIEYLSAFGSESSALVFRPLGSEVIVSIDGVAYAEYKCAVDAPLENRFAVPLRIPARLIATLADDSVIEFSLGSHLRMTVEKSEFVSPLSDIEKLPDPPKVCEGVTFTWASGKFVPELKAALASTMQGHGGSTLECVRIEVLPARETIVSSDGRRLSVYEAKANGDNGVRRSDDVNSQVLIHRAAIPLILATCKSLGRISLRSGLSHFVVECGRRKAIIPLQEGAFPQWREALEGILASPKIGAIEVDRAEFLRAIRQVKADAEQSAGAVQIVGHADELELIAQCPESGSYSRAYVGLGKRSTTFGTINVAAKFLLSAANNWPEGQPIIMEYRGATSPLVFSRKRFRAFVMPMLSDSPQDTEQPTDVDTSNPAAVRGENTGRSHRKPPDR
jgi:DNA polymerase III sliding clamp (beta) subunit (PCNA family)